MKKIESWKTWTFIGILLMVVVMINGGYDHLFRSEPKRIPSSSYYPEPVVSQPTSSKPAAEASIPEQRYAAPVIPQKTPQELAAERARFIAKYVKEGIGRTPNSTTVLVAVTDADGKTRPALASVLAAHVASSSVLALPSAFTSSFTTDGLMAEAFRDSASVVTKLDLEKVADVLLLARESAEYVRNDSSLANVLTAKTELEVIAISVSRPTEARTWTFSANGPGFKNSDALAAAEERIIKQITNGGAITLP